MEPTRALYLHGLESGPQAAKAMALSAAGFAVTAPLLETAVVKRLLEVKDFTPSTWAEAMALPVSQAVAALAESRAQVVVGSSFGAAVLLRLLHEGHGVGVPAVFLAGAGVRLTPLRTIPAGVRALLVHGAQDEVVPRDDSRLLAASSPDAVLVEVHDDHRLTKTTASGLLVELVRLALRLR
ncbi:MAG: hypothetical protein AB1938_03695 [Myxococcota bacterium]